MVDIGGVHGRRKVLLKGLLMRSAVICNKVMQHGADWCGLAQHVR